MALFLSYNAECYVGGEVESQEEDFIYPEKRVIDEIEILSGNWVEFALETVDEIRSHHEDDRCVQEHGSVDNGAPFEEFCCGLNVHDLSSWAYLLVITHTPSHSPSGGSSMK